MRCVYARLDISCKEFKQIFWGFKNIFSIRKSLESLWTVIPYINVANYNDQK